MAFSWFFKPKKDSKTLGINLGAGEGIKAEIDKMQGSIVKASKGYQNNIKKYKEIAQFNQHLTRSYVANLKVIVDVSELLNSYTGVFNSLKDEFAKMEEAMGRQLDKSDFEYLESLTKSKMDELNVEFNKQANGIKKLYAQYGKPEELDRILVAQNDMQKALDNANATYASVVAVETPKAANANVSKANSSNTKANSTANASNTLVGNSGIKANAGPQSFTESIAESEQALVNASLKKANTNKSSNSNNSTPNMEGGKKQRKQTKATDTKKRAAPKSSRK